MATARRPSEFANAKHRAQADKFMLELGRFVVAFERMCAAVRHAIELIYRSEGLTHPGLERVIVGDTASAQLQLLLGASFAELRARTDAADQKAVQGLLKEIDALTQMRNIAVHSAWRFGLDEAEYEFYGVAVRPRTRQKHGGVSDVQGLSARYLRALTARAKQLEGAVARLQHCIVDKSLKVSVQLGARSEA